MKIALVGAGFSCAVIANKLAQKGHLCTVYESRNHIAGNCYIEKDKETGISVHKYGPHIFHTNDKDVWDFINSLIEMKPFTNRVKSITNNTVYSMPINLHTINQFFSKVFSPKEAEEFIRTISDSSIVEPQNFEEQALKFIGKDLYEAFFKGYTIKQWGIDPKELPASILKRLPVRFSYDDNYFNHKYQGMPASSYNEAVEKLLSHENIFLKLNTKFERNYSKKYDHVFFSGPLDSYFDYSLGRLGYRTLDFIREIHDGDYQGNPVINYPDKAIEYTRITEHKHFTPWNEFDKTIIYKEYSRQCEDGDIPYYPINLVAEKELLSKYIALAKSTDSVTFVGRLGTYKYLDMDVTIRKALDAADLAISYLDKKDKIPPFLDEM